MVCMSSYCFSFRRIAVFSISVCLLLSLALVGQATVQQAEWTAYEEKKLDCLIKAGSGTLNFKDYGFNEQDDVEDVCPIPDDGWCAGLSEAGTAPQLAKKP